MTTSPCSAPASASSFARSFVDPISSYQCSSRPTSWVLRRGRSSRGVSRSGTSASRYPRAGSASIRYPWARSASTCFQTAARVRPSLSEMASPETNSSTASARKARTSSSDSGRSAGIGNPWISLQLEGDVHRASGVGDRAHRHEVHARGGHPRQALERHVAARLQEHPAGCPPDRLRHGGVVHVVEEDDLGAGGDGGLQPREVHDLDLELEHRAGALTSAADRLGHPSAGGDVVVLDEDAVTEGEAMVLPAARPD